MAKTKTTTAKAANVRAARKAGKTGKRTGNGGGGGSNDPDSNETDDLFPSSRGDDDGGGGGDDSDNELFYDYNYMSGLVCPFLHVKAYRLLSLPKVDKGV